MGTSPIATLPALVLALKGTVNSGHDKIGVCINAGLSMLKVVHKS